MAEPTFLGLPLELRWMIYDAYCPHSHMIANPEKRLQSLFKDDEGPRPFIRSILGICKLNKQTRSEALSHYFGLKKIHFVIGNTVELTKFLDIFPTDILSLINSVELSSVSVLDPQGYALDPGLYVSCADERDINRMVELITEWKVKNVVVFLGAGVHSLAGNRAPLERVLAFSGLHTFALSFLIPRSRPVKLKSGKDWTEKEIRKKVLAAGHLPGED